MMNKPLLFLFLLALHLGQAKAQKIAPPWPGVPYTYARVFLYNLDNQLYGQYQAWKNGVPNFTLVAPGTRLEGSQVKMLEAVLNSDTRVLNEGLAKCYEPHHAVFFYNAQDKIVAAFDVCFLCEGVRFYPAKQYKSEIKKYTEAMTKTAQQQLEQIKNIFTGAGVPVFKTRNEPVQYAQKKLVKKDTLIIVNDSVFNHLVKDFSSIKELRQALGEQRYTIDSSYTYKFTNNMIRTYDFHGPDLKINVSVIAGGKPWITDLMIKNRSISLLNGVQVGKGRVDIYRLFEKALNGYFYNRCLVLKHSQMELSLIINFDEEAQVDHIHYYLKH